MSARMVHAVCVECRRRAVTRPHDPPWRSGDRIGPAAILRSASRGAAAIAPGNEGGDRAEVAMSLRLGGVLGWSLSKPE